MTPERWQRLQAIVEEALERPSGDRRAHVETACGDDEELRREALRLLSGVEREDDALADVVGRAAADAAGAPDPFTGTRIGPYRISRELGRGGMGTVYLGERVDGGFEQAVAIKFLSGMVGERAERRLRRERRILSRLDHPNIARLLDGGLTPEGHSYLVMEYIDGEPLDRYCDSRRLGIDRRLDLLSRILSAVDYAHRHLIVHRDLKPGNILVTAEGEPKLLDFGIAALVDTDDDSEAAPATVMQALTPEYASPEQIRGETVTTASDVYSLGVLMYELLTGRKCLEFDSLRPSHIEAIVDTRLPQDPSAAVRDERTRPARPDPGEQTDARDLSARRSTTPAALARTLRGDLDAICQQALRKEPDQRYPSARAMLEDLAAQARREPVSARGLNWRYRTGRFVARHRLGVGAAAAAVLLLGAFAAAMTAMSWRLAEERDRAVAAEAEAREEQATSERVVDFLVSLFQHSDPENARGESLSARDLLDRGTERLEKELADEAPIRARLYDVMARVYRSLGAREQAEALARRAVAERERIYGPIALETAESMTTLAETLRRSGQREEALELYRRVLAIRSELDPPPSDAVAESQNNLGVLMVELARYEEGEKQIRSAFEQRLELFGTDHPLTALTLHNLGYLQSKTGAYQEAEETLRRALELRQAALEEDHPGILRTRLLLGTVLLNRGNLAEAEALHEENLAQARRLYDEPHPRLSDALNELAAVLQSQNKLERAAELYREAIDIEKTLGQEGTMSMAIRINNYAFLLDDLGRAEAAERHYRRSLDIRRDVMGDSHPKVAHALDNLGAFLTRQGRLDEARPLLDRALEVRRAAFEGEHHAVAETLVNRAMLAQAERDHATAEALAREGRSMYASTMGPEHWRHAWAGSVLGAALAAGGQYEQSRELLESGYSLIRAKKGDEAPVTQRALARLEAWAPKQRLPSSDS